MASVQRHVARLPLVAIAVASLIFGAASAVTAVAYPTPPGAAGAVPAITAAVASAADTTPPSVPAGLTAKRRDDGRAVLTWQAATDDRAGKLRYLVYRDGLAIASTTSTRLIDAPIGRTATSYAYSVAAVDPAGNRSPRSAPASVRVAPARYPFAGRAYSYGDRSRPMVALTFDDCYLVNNVREIVRILRSNNVAGTFFCTGEALGLDRALFADLATSFPIGNHTWDHPNLNNLSESAILNQLARTTREIESVTRWGAPALMRPPYGKATAATRATIGKTGLPVIRWDIDTLDWKQSSTTASIVAAVSSARNGSIVLMHDKRRTVAALPQVIAALKQRGFRLVSVPELLGLPWQPAER